LNPFTYSESLINPLVHHFVLILIQEGINSGSLETANAERLEVENTQNTEIIPIP
jgi:hypothetical protein